MYGSWAMITLGAVGAILLLVGLMFTPAAPIFALAVVLIVAAVAVFAMASSREGSEAATESARADQESDKPSWRRKRWHE